jgi:hypothetical protein
MTSNVTVINGKYTTAKERKKERKKDTRKLSHDWNHEAICNVYITFGLGLQEFLVLGFCCTAYV